MCKIRPGKHKAEIEVRVQTDGLKISLFSRFEFGRYSSLKHQPLSPFSSYLSTSNSSFYISTTSFSFTSPSNSSSSLFPPLRIHFPNQFTFHLPTTCHCSSSTFLLFLPSLSSFFLSSLFSLHPSRRLHNPFCLCSLIYFSFHFPHSFFLSFFTSTFPFLH